MGAYVRIIVLWWADVLAGFVLWVMQTYLTDVWKLSFTHAAAVMNIWEGLNRVLPLGLIFLADTFLGHHGLLALSSIAYTLGMGFLSMSTPPVLANATHTCKIYEPECIGDAQKVLFYTSMALLAVGVSGYLVSRQPFLAENMNDGEDGGLKVLLRLPGLLIVAVVAIVGGIALPYIKPWSIRFGIPAICTAVATLAFFTGWREYSKPEPEGSPLTNVCRVFLASACKIFKPRTPRCESLEEQKIVTVTDVGVGDAKIVVRMIPMWTTFIICGIVSSIGNTYFLEQANHMNQNLGKWKVPLTILLILIKVVNLVFRKLYDWMRDRCFSGCKKYAPPVGIGVAMLFSVLCCITAARMEIQRLNVIRRHGLIDKPEDEVPMSMFWLVFQFVLLAGLDSFLEKSTCAFLKDQAPETMESYLEYFTRGVSGLGFVGSVLSVYVVGRVSKRGGGQNWFQYTLNKSRLDRYYWVLAAFSSANLLVYILIARRYEYKEPKQREAPQTGESAQRNDDGSHDCSCCCC